MTVLSDKWIKKIAKQKGMIRPFVSKQIRKGKFFSVRLCLEVVALVCGYICRKAIIMKSTQIQVSAIVEDMDSFSGKFSNTFISSTP